jgi:hypothetical protein
LSNKEEAGNHTPKISYCRLRVITRSRRSGIEHASAVLFVPEKFQISWRYIFDDMTPGEITKFIRMITDPHGRLRIPKTAWTLKEIKFLQYCLKHNYSPNEIMDSLKLLEPKTATDFVKIKERKRTRHHLTPKARGGKNGNSKIVRLPRRFHESWHYVLDHLFPEEMVKFIRVFLQGKGLKKQKRRWTKYEITALRIIIQQNSLKEVTEKIRNLFS